MTATAPFRYDIVGSFLRPASLKALDGVTEVHADHWSVAFKGAQPKASTIAITGKIDFTDHPFLNHFRFLKKAAGETLAKMTIPSPSMLHLIACVRTESYTPIERYRDEAVLFEDIAAAYQKAVLAFYDAGCRYLQLDDTSWGEFCDEDKREAYAKLKCTLFTGHPVRRVHFALYD